MDNDLKKENKYLKISDKKDKITDSTIYFKKWYMNHTLDWMDGFNDCLELVHNLIKYKN